MEGPEILVDDALDGVGRPVEECLPLWRLWIFLR